MENISTRLIGDGKMPNKYWVSISNDYYYYNQEVEAYDWISGLNLFEVKSKTIGQFKTYKEAMDFCLEISLGMDYDGIRVNCITIEDRLSGELYCRNYEFFPASGEVSETSREDTGFTLKTMAMKYNKVMV